MDASSEYTGNKRFGKEYVNDNNWHPEVLNVPTEDVSQFVSGEKDVRVPSFRVSGRIGLQPSCFGSGTFVQVLGTTYVG